MDLVNKVAIVTGGASGIGLACVEEFLASGAKVVIADWNEEVEKIASDYHNENVVGMRVDVSKDQQVVELVQRTVDRFGHLDIMIANAGIGSRLLAHEETMGEWSQVLDINLTGVFLCCKYALKQFLNQGMGGSIVNMASILGLVGSPNAFAYSATKGAIINMTRTMGVTYAKQKIRVNAIAPGYVDTPILTGMTPEIRQMLEQAHPIGRLGRSEEIAHAVHFLVSDASSFVTGITLPVDGGYTSQ